MTGTEYAMIALTALLGGVVSYGFWALGNLAGGRRVGIPGLRKDPPIGKQSVTGQGTLCGIQAQKPSHMPPPGPAPPAEPTGDLAQEIQALRTDLATLAGAHLDAITIGKNRDSQILSEVRGIVEALRPDLENRLIRIEEAVTGAAATAPTRRQSPHAPDDTLQVGGAETASTPPDADVDGRLVAMLERARATGPPTRPKDDPRNLTESGGNAGVDAAVNRPPERTIRRG